MGSETPNLRGMTIRRSRGSASASMQPSSTSITFDQGPQAQVTLLLALAARTFENKTHAGAAREICSSTVT